MDEKKNKIDENNQSDQRLPKVILGCLLHDIGKIVQRSELLGKSNKANHSKYGEQYAKEYLKIEDPDIWEQILFHHEHWGKNKEPVLENAYKDGKINKDSLAFIVNCADNIASGCDRRLREEGANFPGWKQYRALHSVFNCLYEEKERYRYGECKLMKRNEIPFPEKKQFSYTKEYYAKQLKGFYDEVDKAKLIPFSDYEFINAFICLLEKYFTFMADDTSNAKLADVSLFDHLKMTAAFGSCIYLYAKEQQYTDYYKIFLNASSKTKFYSTKAFMLVNFSISGIQKFVYSIPSDGALKNLRGRSFYVNLLMEFITDQFLDKLGLSRANVLYIGGGSVTLLLPNLNNIISEIKNYSENINKWLIQNFQSSLFLEYGYNQCSAYDFRTQSPKKYGERVSFTNLISDTQVQIYEMKTHRFSANNIRMMNASSYSEKSESRIDGERECKICQITAKLIYDDAKDDYYCPICFAIQRNANSLLAYNEYKETDSVKGNKKLFSIEQRDENETVAFILPFDKQMSIVNHETTKTEYVYNKNDIKVEINAGKYLWVGDYVGATTLEQMAKKAGGIDRIAVIRADVDDLGESFRKGFIGRPNSIDRDTVSRKATYSRMLTLFFQYYINGILEEGKYSLESNKKSPIKRNAAIVYSGGDDLFIVGGWDDVIGFAVDLYQAFKRYSQEKLTISAGIGIYPPKYPISAIAKETGLLELSSKMNAGNKLYARDKDSVTLFSEEFTFHWGCFIDKVLGEKYKLIKDVFDSKECGERGITFLHTILVLMKNIQNSEISLARYAFLIARLEPKRNSKNKEYVENYKKLKEKLYVWMKSACGKEQQTNNDENDVKQCIVAIYLYLYLRRKDDGTE